MSKIHHPAAHVAAFFKLTESLPDRFQRTRIWSPRRVLVWLMLIALPDRKTSYRRSVTCLTFFGRRWFGWQKIPAIASISKARRKLSIDMCREFLLELVARCEQRMPTAANRFGSRRFIAFDGTRTVLPRSKGTATKFHRPKRPDGSRVHNPQGLLVAAVDLFRRLPLDWSFTGKGVGERTAMRDLVGRIAWQPGDVAVMDRGFPSRELFAELSSRGVDIIARMSASKTTWSELRPFLKSEKKSGELELNLQGVNGPVTVRVRIVERDRKRGRPRKGTKSERMIILSTLREEDGFDRKALIQLYGARWGIESLFGEMKSFMDIERFHSDNAECCEQEIVASMIWMALASYLQAEAESGLTDGRRVVRADCLRVASDLVSDIIKGHKISDSIELDIQGLRQGSYNPQADRHYPRECKRPYGRSIQRGGR